MNDSIFHCLAMFLPFAVFPFSQFSRKQHHFLAASAVLVLLSSRY